MIRLALLALVPIAPLLHYVFGLPPIWVFLAGIVGVGVLATGSGRQPNSSHNAPDPPSAVC